MTEKEAGAESLTSVNIFKKRMKMVDWIDRKWKNIMATLLNGYSVKLLSANDP